jgi:hypothetical protein
LSAVGSVTDDPFARVVPPSVALQSIVALLLASIFTCDTVTFSLLASNGEITEADALRRLVMSLLLALDTCEARSATVREVSVTLRLIATPCEISTAPR